MTLQLVRIPDVLSEWESSHPVRALEVEGKSPVLDQLAYWKSAQRADYKKLLRALNRVAGTYRVLNENHVTSDGGKTGIFELRAHGGHARVFFFYDSDHVETVVCVHTYWKGSGNQSAAFDKAAALMRVWKTASSA